MKQKAASSAHNTITQELFLEASTIFHNAAGVIPGYLPFPHLEHYKGVYSKLDIY